VAVAGGGVAGAGRGEGEVGRTGLCLAGGGDAPREPSVVDVFWDIRAGRRSHETTGRAEGAGARAGLLREKSIRPNQTFSSPADAVGRRLSKFVPGWMGEAKTPGDVLLVLFSFFHYTLVAILLTSPRLGVYGV